MHDDEQLDQALARVAQSLRAGDRTLAGLQLATFSLKLEHWIRHQERVLAFAYEPRPGVRPNPLAKIRLAHASLRRLLGALAQALERADARRGLELASRLHEVLVVRRADHPA